MWLLLLSFCNGYSEPVGTYFFCLNLNLLQELMFQKGKKAVEETLQNHSKFNLTIVRYQSILFSSASVCNISNFCRSKVYSVMRLVSECKNYAFGKSIDMKSKNC